MATKDVSKLMRQIYESIRDGNTERTVNLLDRHPDMAGYSDSATNSWLHEAAGYGRLGLVDYLLGIGADINFAYGKEQETPLGKVVSADDLPDRPGLIRALLDRGADPNISRPLIRSINPRRGDEPTSLELVRLLVEGGADVTRVYDWYGNQDHTFTALEFAEMHGRSAIAAYLRSAGAADRPKPAPPVKTKRK